MTQRLSFLISALWALWLLTPPAFAQISTAEVEARNEINAGDESRNIIATGSSVVYVFIDEDNQRIERSREAVLDDVRLNHDERLRDAQERFPNREIDFIERIALADHVFAQGQYSLSASIYHNILGDMALSDYGYNIVEGMVTASFYGAARHLEGLRYVCEQYAFRPSWSFRFRHAIHAHLRALAAHLGNQRAEEILTVVRRDPQCQRDDFSLAWIPIHLTDMRALERGRPFWEWQYGINEIEDIELAERVLEEGNHGFDDYILFTMGRFDEIVENYPNSYIYDLALLGIGWKAEPEHAIPALEEYLARFDNRTSDAFSLLLQRAEEVGGQELVDLYRSRYADVTDRGYGVSRFAIPIRVSRTVRVWVQNRAFTGASIRQRNTIARYYRDCPRYASLFENGAFEELAVSFQEWIRVYNEEFAIDLQMEGYYAESENSFNFFGVCVVDFSPQRLAEAYDVVAGAVSALEAFDAEALVEIGRELKLCGDIRDRLVEQFGNCSSIIETMTRRAQGISLHRASAGILRRGFELSGSQDHSSLFLSALAYRRVGEYEYFLRDLEQYSVSFPDREFADDALTEIGWFYLVIDNNPQIADRYFQIVVDNYPNTNAYDNALNWLVISRQMQGDYSSAFMLSARLVVQVASDRLMRKVTDRDEEIREITQIVGDSVSVLVGEDYRGHEGFAMRSEVRLVVRQSSTPLLPTGSEVTMADGLRFTDAHELYVYMEDVHERGAEMVQISYRLPTRSETQTRRFPIRLFIDISSR